MTSFLNACGISGSLKLLIKGPGPDQAQVSVLQQPFAIIGRNLRADVVLDHEQVSRRHIYLQVIEGRVFWIDLGSRTGTRVGKRPQKLGWLEGRQPLAIGPYEVRLSKDVSQKSDSAQSFLSRDVPFPVRAYMEASMPEVALEFLNGPSQSTRWPVHRVMSLLGSATGCKLRLADPSVSRYHASLVRTAAGLWVVDLLGQSGITVNSAPVRFSRLEDADVLEIGRYQVRIQCRWQSQELGNRSPGSTLLSTLRLQNHDPNHPKLGNWAATAMEFATESANPEEAEAHLLEQTRPTSVEIMPATGIYPVKPAQSDSTESILVPLVNQFNLMQQQMFDQFQQAMSMLVQMFGKMHRDQMDVIRIELDRLHELTQEFKSLKDELVKRTQSQPFSRDLRNAPALSDPAPTGHSEQENRTVSSPVQTPASKSQATAKPSTTSADIPTDSTRFPLRMPGSNTPGDGRSDKYRLSGTSDPLPPGPYVPPPTPEQFQSVGSRSRNSGSDSGSGADADKDTIIWLHQRIMSIQRERESRWQKILKLLPGAS
jgi:pSer/pThr/pTyr-binding forkhead associated (FHA) protein